MSDKCEKCGQLLGDHSYGQCPGTIGSAAALMGRKGGSAKSEAKQAASRSNGARGGRPRELASLLGEHWGVDREDAKRVLLALDFKRWNGGEGLAGIIYAGVIDNDHSDKFAGHNGYWIASVEGNICYVTNSDSVWCEWDEETADAIGVPWGEFGEEMDGYKINKGGN
jgi:hypothetical protein